MASELKVNKITPESGVTLTLGDLGDTINFGSGVLPNFENLTVTGDLTVDTNSLKVDSTNNFVGIGTASPTVALDVVGAITATGNITGTLATAAQPNITSLGTLTGLTTTGDINFGDNDKAVFGAGNDLQIYHDGSNSYIDDVGTGNMFIRADDYVIIDKSDSSKRSASFNTDDAVILYFNNNQKFTTTSTGIDVTGTVVSDGLTVDNGGTNSSLQLGGTYNYILQRSGTDGALEFKGFQTAFSDFVFKNSYTADAQYLQRMRIGSSGDISFYEDTGTTPKLFWDASTERLGIGTSSPANSLEVNYATVGTGNGSNNALALVHNSSSMYAQHFMDGNGIYNIYADQQGVAGGNLTLHADNNIRFSTGIWTSATGDVVIDSSGRVGIGVAPTGSWQLQVAGSSSNSRVRMQNTTTGFADGDGGSISMEGNDFVLQNSETGVVKVEMGGTERMRIDSSGNVGIGTTSPSSFNSQARNLVVGTGSGANGITIYSGNTSTADIFFADGTTGEDRVRGGINYNHSNNSMNFRVNDSPRMYILTSGNVGIGTSSPASKLEVEDSVNGDMHLRINNTNTGSSARTLLLLESDGATGSLYLNGANRVSSGVDQADSMTLTSDSSASNGLNINATSGSMKFYYNYLEKMRITSAGNVGIGTSSPSTALDVNGTVTATAFSGSGSGITGIPNTAQVWVNFNGTGTVAIRDDYNVSSITDNGTGDYTVNFTSSLANTNYSFTTASGKNSANQYPVTVEISSSTSNIRVVNANLGAAPVDNDLVCIHIFGG
jgi:hypothetical protein